jgi:signal peptidase I
VLSEEDSMVGSDSIDLNNFGPVIIPKKGDVIEVTPVTFRHWKHFIEREHHRVSIDPDNKVVIDGQESSRYSVTADYYFVLGDNRGNSLDSRSWGFVPDDHVIGEALVVYWSWDTENVAGGILDRLKNIRWNRVGTLIQ